MSGTFEVKVYNDDSELTIRTLDNTSRAHMDRRLKSGDSATINIPRAQPEITVVRPGREDVTVKWNKTADFQPKRDAPAT